MMLTNMKKGMIVSAVFYICLGIAMIVFPDFLAKLVCYVLGALLAVTGVVKIVNYFRNRSDAAFFQLDLLVGMLAIVMSILFIMMPESLLGIIPIVLGVALIAGAVTKLQLAFQLKGVGYDKWWVHLIFAALFIAIAVVLMVTDPIKLTGFLIILAGVGFIVDGLVDLWSIFHVQRVLKNLKKNMAVPPQPEGTPVDGTGTVQ